MDPFHEVAVVAHHPLRRAVRIGIAALAAVAFLVAVALASLRGVPDPGPEPARVDLSACSVDVITPPCRDALPERLRALPAASQWADLQALRRLPSLGPPDDLTPFGVTRAGRLPSIPPVSSDPTKLEDEARLFESLGYTVPAYTPDTERIDLDEIERRAPVDWTETQHLLARLVVERHNREVDARVRWHDEIRANELAYRGTHLPFYWRAAEHASTLRHQAWEQSVDQARRSREAESATLPLALVGAALLGCLGLAWVGTAPRRVRVTAHTVSIGGVTVPMHDIVGWDGMSLDRRSGGAVSLGVRTLDEADRRAVTAAIELGRATEREARPEARAAVQRLA